MVCPGVEVDWPDIEPVVCPADAPAVPAPADPVEPVCKAAIKTGEAVWLRAVGFADGVDPH